MSSQALLDTIYVELKQKREEGKRFAAISPGNYGLEYMKRAYGLRSGSKRQVQQFYREDDGYGGGARI